MCRWNARPLEGSFWVTAPGGQHCYHQKVHDPRNIQSKWQRDRPKQYYTDHWVHRLIDEQNWKPWCDSDCDSPLYLCLFFFSNMTLTWNQEQVMAIQGIPFHLWVGNDYLIRGHYKIHVHIRVKLIHFPAVLKSCLKFVWCLSLFV